jgi:tellurium resistance protein TerZ
VNLTGAATCSPVNPTSRSRKRHTLAINLSKGQKLSLTKPGGGTLTRIHLGLGWDAVPSEKKGLFGKAKQRDIDLDASVISFDASGQVADYAYFNQLNSRDGSIHHQGDNLTGAGDGDDEVIIIDLDRVPANVKSLVAVITSYSKQSFNEIANAFARVVDLSGGAKTELATFNLSEKGAHTGLVMAKITREANGWQFDALGAPASGRATVYSDLISDAQKLL